MVIVVSCEVEQRLNKKLEVQVDACTAVLVVVLVVGSRLRLSLTSAVCRFVSLTTTRSSVGVVAH